MSNMKAEELIEEVRKHPVLYDQSAEQYRNAEFKDQVWKRIAKELNIEGEEEECKKKWNGIRDSLRRARQKKKTKSGQAATSGYKYKYEVLLEFLIPHIAERKGLSNVPDEADDDDAPETVEESQQQNSTQETQYPPDGGCDDQPVATPEPPPTTPLPPPTTPASRAPIGKKPSYAARKRKLQNVQSNKESASSQLMAYILSEKEAEKTSQQPEIHPVDAFLAGIAPTLKSLDPVLLISAKGKIFNVVQEYELQQVRANSERRTTLSYTYHSTSSGQTSSASTPLFVEETGPWTDGILNFTDHLATAVNHPTITPEQEQDKPTFMDLQ